MKSGNENNFGNEADANIENLRSYAQFKLELADKLRMIQQGLKALDREEAEKQCSDLMVKLAEDRFTLAVLGQFKRGKSSIMNAFIGKELLPTGVLPVTSAITKLRYGPVERLLINYNKSIFPSELSVSEISEYVTQEKNPNNEKRVKEVYVELPLPFLRYGIEFVDTPGVGSSIIANTATTYNFLPECDAVLFVTSADTPLTSLELEFLEKIKEYANRIFFIVNKIDLVSNEERGEIVKFVMKTINDHFESNVNRIFPVSSRIALEARTTNSSKLYEQSGLKTLEDTLASFLTEAKSNVFLTSIIQKVISILNTEASQNIFSEDFLQQRAIAIQKEEKITATKEPYSASASITKAYENLEILYQRLSNNTTNESFNFRSGLPELKQKQQKNFLIEELFTNNKIEKEEVTQNLRIRGCPVCEHIANQAFDFFAHLQYKLVTDERTKNEFAKEIAFCPLHTWQLLSISSPYGASVGYAKLAEEIAEKLKAHEHLHYNPVFLKEFVHTSADCRMCKFLREVESSYIQKFAETINDEEGRNKYRKSEGVCMKHLSMLLNAASTEETQKFLLSHSIKSFEDDAEDMRSFALKQDARRRGLQNKNEEDAYRRTIIRIAGDRRVCMPWPEDGEI
jgi:predicted GTPase